MNLMRQREDIKSAVAAGALKPGMAEKALRSPVFQWYSSRQDNRAGDPNLMLPEEIEFIEQNLMESVFVPPDVDYPEGGTVNWPRFTPYECFRVSYMDAPIYDQWWVNDKEMCCLHVDDGWSHKDIKTWTTHYKSKDKMGYWGLHVWVNGKMLDTGELATTADKDRQIQFNVGKVSMKASYNEMVNYAGNVIQMLAIFMFDIYGSGATVVKVSPPADSTKSVQWRQAREHYLVLRRQQVEKLRESKGSVTDNDIIRAAHWRRAHLRRLSSHKFINKRGLLVPVKKSWVGPTEWIGNDGKVYTVVGMGNPLDKH